MFTIKAEDGAARVGVLSMPHGAIDTPGMLVYTRRGGAINLTPDLLEDLKPQAVQLDVLHFLKQPSPAVLSDFPGGSARQFLGLPAAGCVVVAAARDPTTYEYAGVLRQSTDTWASVATHCGGTTVTPSQYMAAVGALQPDVFVALGDEVPCDAKHERAVAAVRRSLAWLRECVQLRTTDGALQRTALFATVQGSQYLQERQRCAAELAHEPGVAGFAIGGLGTGESPKLRGEILEQVVGALPAHKPRLVSGLGAPEEVLEAIAKGVDLFDMGYIAEVVAGGYALCFPLSPEVKHSLDDTASAAAAAAAAVAAGGLEDGSSMAAAAMAVAGKGSLQTGDGPSEDGVAGCCSITGGDDTKMNLWDLRYRTDPRPLLPGCTCFACRNHTRAYVHHLLHSHEMLAQVLLEAHNTHHYLQWFAELRRTVAAGRLAHYADWFLERRRQAMMG